MKGAKYRHVLLQCSAARTRQRLVRQDVLAYNAAAWTAACSLESLRRLKHSPKGSANVYRLWGFSRVVGFALGVYVPGVLA